MHCYVDMEQYGGLSLDEALRLLLAGFRCGQRWAGLEALGVTTLLLPTCPASPSLPPHGANDPSVSLAHPTPARTDTLAHLACAGCLGRPRRLIASWRSLRSGTARTTRRHSRRVGG